MTWGFPRDPGPQKKGRLTIYGRPGAGDSFSDVERSTYEEPIGAVEDALAAYHAQYPGARQFLVDDGTRIKLFRLDTRPSFNEI